MSLFGTIANGVLGLLTGGSARKTEEANRIAEDRRRSEEAVKSANDRANRLEIAQINASSKSGGSNQTMILGIGGAVVVLLGFFMMKK